MSVENKERRFKSKIDIWLEAQFAAGLARHFTDEENAAHAEHHSKAMEPKHPTARFLAGKSELDNAKIILD